MIVCDEDATLELKVKTVRYFKSIQQVMNMLEEHDHHDDHHDEPHDDGSMHSS